MPIIHLKELYEIYLKDDDIQICVDYILEISKTRKQVEIQMLVGTWEEKKTQISMRLINSEWN